MRAGLAGRSRAKSIRYQWPEGLTGMRWVPGAAEHVKEGAAREINKIPAARRLIEESMFRAAGIAGRLAQR
jgi:hypothetical protein